jgi:hypothetical protein
MNTVSNVNRSSCGCKDGYYKSSSDKSELSPCYGKFADLLLFSAFWDYLLWVHNVDNVYTFWGAKGIWVRDSEFD